MARKKPHKPLTPTDEAIAEITEKFGDGALQRGRGTFVSVEAIPTGVVNIDVATGCGGLPRGRIIELFGNESSGKTTLCLHAIASCQARGGTAAFVDAEHAFDLDWAEAMGVDMDQLLIAQPDSGEEALNIVETLVEKKAVDLAVVDSVAALVPKEELDGDVGDYHIGAQARMLSQSMRKLSGKIKRSRAAVLFVNQLREKIGVKFGNPEQTPGGRALKFYASMRIEIKRKGNLAVQQIKVYGMESRAKIVKNKVAPPFLAAEFEIHFGQPFQEPSRKGIYKELALANGAISSGVLRVSGSHYYFGDSAKSIANGKSALVDLLVGDAELRDKLSRAVYEVLESRVSKDKKTNENELEPDS